MKINFCPTCGMQLHGKVRFCSKCGDDLTPFNHQKNQPDNMENVFKGFIEEFLESNGDLLKDIVRKAGEGPHVKKGMFFAVEMKGDKPVIKSGDMKDFKEIFSKLNKKTGSISENSGEIEFKEAKSRIVEENFERKIIVEMPGVENLGDISVSPVENALEIEGKGEKVIYFARIPVKGLFEIKGRELIDESLVIRIK